MTKEKVTMLKFDLCSKIDIPVNDTVLKAIKNYDDNFYNTISNNGTCDVPLPLHPKPIEFYKNRIVKNDFINDKYRMTLADFIKIFLIDNNDKYFYDEDIFYLHQYNNHKKDSFQFDLKTEFTFKKVNDKPIKLNVYQLAAKYKDNFISGDFSNVFKSINFKIKAV